MRRFEWRRSKEHDHAVTNTSLVTKNLGSSVYGVAAMFLKGLDEPRINKDGDNRIMKGAHDRS